MSTALAAELPGSPAVKENVPQGKLAMWLFLVSEIMFFAGLFGAYIVLRIAHPELFAPDYLEKNFHKLNEVLAGINTLVLICSSLTMALAVHASQHKDDAGVRKWMFLTAFFGVAFCTIKGFEYAGKFNSGIFPGTSIFFSFYFTMTGVHLVHVIGGIIPIAWMGLRSSNGRYTSNGNSTIEYIGLYWHFVDVVWIFLFPLLYLLK